MKAFKSVIKPPLFHCFAGVTFHSWGLRSGRPKLRQTEMNGVGDAVWHVFIDTICWLKWDVLISFKCTSVSIAPINLLSKTFFFCLCWTIFIMWHDWQNSLGWLLIKKFIFVHLSWRRKEHIQHPPCSKLTLRKSEDNFKCLKFEDHPHNLHWCEI